LEKQSIQVFSSTPDFGSRKASRSDRRYCYEAIVRAAAAQAAVDRGAAAAAARRPSQIDHYR